MVGLTADIATKARQYIRNTRFCVWFSEEKQTPLRPCAQNAASPGEHESTALSCKKRWGGYQQAGLALGIETNSSTCGLWLLRVFTPATHVLVLV
jgi:hypothetical protein